MINAKWWLECKSVNRYDDNTWYTIRKFKKKPKLKKIKKELGVRNSNIICRLVKIYEK